MFGPLCFLCGGALRPLARGAGEKWARCAACGLVRQQDPPPFEVTQGRYVSPGPEAFAPPKPDRRFKFRVVGDALAARGLSGRLIDVGCGSGQLQEYLASRGWTNSVGVDPSPAASGRSRPGLEILHEPVEAALERPSMAGSFDVAVGHHVIEHCYDPRVYLRQIRAFLKPGGHALIATPNLSGAAMRGKTLLSRLGWKRRPYRHLDYPKHLVLFRRGNVADLFRGEGFEVLEVQTYTRASGTGADSPRRFRLWDRLSLGDNMYVLARRPLA